MNWFWFALIALICWSGSDLFSKIGCCGEKDKTAHLKMVVAVGIVMGLHAAYMIVFHHVSVTWDVVWTYLPVSLLYIGSMTLGYVGLRYIELSISSPICNSSGAIVAVLVFCTAGISEELQAVLFERFARGDGSRARKTGSTGLGLSIVAAVVEGHGGTVAVESQSGKTVFTVRLPLAAH